jgi:putative copper export protein
MLAKKVRLYDLPDEEQVLTPTYGQRLLRKSLPLYWLLGIAVPKRVSIMALLRPFSNRTGPHSNADVEPK